jgi:hypothetical protein
MNTRLSSSREVVVNEALSRGMKNIPESNTFNSNKELVPSMILEHPTYGLSLVTMGPSHGVARDYKEEMEKRQDKGLFFKGT